MNTTLNADTAGAATDVNTLNGGHDATRQKLVDDLHRVAKDAEELLRTASAYTGEHIQEARSRAQAALHRVRTQLGDLEAQSARRAREIAVATDQYVKERPWHSVVTAVGVGVVLGVLTSRRH